MPIATPEVYAEMPQAMEVPQAALLEEPFRRAVATTMAAIELAFALGLLLGCTICFELARMHCASTSTTPTTKVDCVPYKVPKRRVSPNRDTTLNPPLRHIVEIHKISRSENPTRKVRPDGWEMNYEVEAILSNE